MSDWLVRRGGKRALLQSAWTPLQLLVTPLSRFARPAQASVDRLVFVCAGNICRSPFAEGLARRHGLTAVSLGLTADPGRPANEAAVRHARAFGIELNGHRACRAAASEFRDGDLVLTFEMWQAQALEPLLLQHAAAVRLLGSAAGLSQSHLFDPYGLPDIAFEHCFTRIALSVERLAQALHARPGSASG